MTIDGSLDFSNLTTLFQSTMMKYADKTAFSYNVNDRWLEVSYKKFHDEAIHLAHWLQIKGLKPGDKVVMLSESRYDWLSFLLACSYSDLTLVPIDIKLSEKESASLIEFINPDLVVLTSKIEAHVNGIISNMSINICLLYTSPSPRDQRGSRMPSSA